MMEPTTQQPPTATQTQQTICPQCHQPVQSTWYFCANCGKDLKEHPPATSIWAQLWLYFFTLVLMPMTAYLIYRYWQGPRYLRSQDPKAHRIGIVSIILLCVSFAALAWYTYAGALWLRHYIEVQQNSMNDLGPGFGAF